jgi:putrescine transport system substrate-binding protein
VRFWGGTTLLDYNKKRLGDLIGKDAPYTSWKLLLDPEWAKKAAPCGIAILNSPSEILPEFLRASGSIPNSQNPMDYLGADRLLRNLKPSIRYFGGDDIIDDLAAGKICLAFTDSGDLAQARSHGAENGEEIILVNPDEGAQMWTDLMAIPIDSKLTESVNKLIDFLLRPQNMAKISNAVEYANPVPSSWAMVDESIRKDQALFPNAEAQKKLYTQYLLTDDVEKIQGRVWNSIKK